MKPCPVGARAASRGQFDPNRDGDVRAAFGSRAPRPWRSRDAATPDSLTALGRRHAGDGVRLNAGVDDVRRQVAKLDVAALRSANEQIEGSFRRHLMALDQDADRLTDGAASVDGSP